MSKIKWKFRCLNCFQDFESAEARPKCKICGHSVLPIAEIKVPENEITDSTQMGTSNEADNTGESDESSTGNAKRDSKNQTDKKDKNDGGQQEEGKSETESQEKASVEA